MPDYSLSRNNPSQNPLSQLSSASQQAKAETENALLREALAMSAQNCEVLMKQFIESQNQFNQNLSQRLQQSEKRQQAQITNLQNMNEAFSKSLNAVLVQTSDKLTAQVKKDVDTAMKANVHAMQKAVQRMEQTATNVTIFEGKLKNNLDKRISAYNSSIQRLFKLNGWRELLFWAGMVGGILTPIILIISKLV